jgi:hypothetical protein
VCGEYRSRRVNTFTPAPNFNGNPATFPYVITDGTLTANGQSGNSIVTLQTKIQIKP